MDVIYVVTLLILFIQICNLRSKVNKLQDQLFKLLGKEDATSNSKRSIMLDEVPWQLEQHANTFDHTAFHEKNTSAVKNRESEHSAKDHVSKKQLNFEQQFGIRLPVWIGAIALVLAGFFMVKYSIEIGMLGPDVRVILGLIFGISLLYAANWVRSKPNGMRIAQALFGAGIADLYVCIFAATSLYHLIPEYIAFIGMTVTTVTAVVLSVRHGEPIALLGLIGGFLTPAMVGLQDLHTPMLLIYLYFIFTGLMIVAGKQCWWPVAVFNVLSIFFWICGWLFSGNMIPGDTVWLQLFLIAVSTTVVIISQQQCDQNLFKAKSLLNYLTLINSLAFTGIIVAYAGFAQIEWGLFFLLSLGGISLAHFNQRLYGLIPWFSTAITAVMLVAWNTDDINALALVISIFGALHVASGYLLQSRSEKPLIWSVLAAATSIGYYFLGYYRLKNIALISEISFFWGILALAFAGLSTHILQSVIKLVPENHTHKQHLMGIYAAAATTFLSTALTIELPREFLSVAFAAQLFATTWINTKLKIKVLRYIVGTLACIFGFLLMPQILLLIQLTAFSLIEARLSIQDGIPMVNWPIFQLGLPALFFIMGSYLLREQKDDKIVSSLEISAIALNGVMGYYLIRHIFHINENVLFIKAGFFERGVVTNVLFLYGLACLCVGRRFARQAVSLSGIALSIVAMFRICYFDLLIYNPLWSSQNIGKLPIFNALLLTYGLPILWTSKIISHIEKVEWRKYSHTFMLLLSFVLVSLNVRQMFHGEYLNKYEISNFEIYSYSMIWLIFGIVLLLIGTLQQDRSTRIASLVVMILTVGKVFLYDASELTGLFRVFSFFGLGLSLLELSWFYTKFVFRKRDEKEQRLPI